MDVDPHYPVVSDEARADLAQVRTELEAEAPKGAEADPFEARLAKERKKAKRKEDARATELVVESLDEGGGQAS
jgi:hypothetical protein